jgi:tetratricopeptide (TPR) repeat protein
MNQPSKNSLCPCGSGKKYKRCCGTSVTARVASDRQDPRHLVELAYRQQQQGDLQSAACMYEKVLAIYPKDSAVLGMRGMVDFAQKNYQEAESWLTKAIHENPRDALLYNFMGQIMDGLGEGIEAERCFAKAVTLAPDFFEGWCNLGISLQNSSQLLEAIDAFQKALGLLPDDEDIHLNLAEVHYLLGNLDQAEDAARKAFMLGIVPSRGNMWLSLMLRAKGVVEESVTAETLAINTAKNPNEIFDLMVKFGRMDVLVGNLTQAEYWLTQAMKTIQNSPTPYIELAESKKFKDADIGFVQKMESFSGNKEPYARRLEFALGKVYTDLGDFQQSFEHYRKANEIACKTIRFDPVELVNDTSRKIDFFTQERMASLPHGSDSSLPVLIVGTPRSGTTLTEQIISSHTQVAGAGELGFWGRLGGNIAKNMSGHYNDKVAETLANGYVNLLRTHSQDAERITDKMPGNFEFVGLIHAVLPRAKIIHCRRHPIDACLSMYFQNFNDNHAYKFSLEGLVVFYEQYLRLMEHWRKVLPPGVMYEIQYEDMVEDTEGESKKLMEFLGLEWEAGQMDFFKKERPVFTCSKWQVRQPIYKSSKARWKRYEQFIEPLLPLLKYAPSV